MEKALNEEIERLRKEPIDQNELDKAKNQLEAAFVYSQASLFYQGMILAQHEIALDWRSVDDYLPSIQEGDTGGYPSGRKPVSYSRTTGPWADSFRCRRKRESQRRRNLLLRANDQVRRPR